MSKEGQYFKALNEIKRDQSPTPLAVNIKFPKPVIGLIASILFILNMAGVMACMAADQKTPAGLLLFPALALLFFCVIYFFVAVYRLHSALRLATNGTYPISPGRALGFHFIPLFNFYWICAWPWQAAKFVNTLEKTRRTSPNWNGFGMLMSALFSRVGIGLVLQMVILTNLVRKIENALTNKSSVEEYCASQDKIKALPLWAVLLIFIPIFGLLTAIAVPNFMHARDVARKRAAAGLPANSTSSNAIDKFNQGRELVRQGMSPEEASKRVIYQDGDRSIDSYYEELGVKKDPAE